MRILVTGWHGQLATALAEAGAHGPVRIILAGRPQLDLADQASIRTTLDLVRPDIVINAAAYTAVDKAESEPVFAHAVNADGAAHVAEACAALAVPLIHISTDYVCAGDGARPYLEDDPTGPVSVYGATKLAGELAIAATLPRHVILRTAWVHSPWGHNFVKTMLRLGATRPSLTVVDDQTGCPTYAPHLAQACLAIAARVVNEPMGSPLWGTYHAVGGGETTWCGFAREIFRLAADHGAAPVNVAPITTADYPTPARRPANSRLDTTKLATAFDIRLPDWHDGAAQCVARLMTTDTPAPTRTTP
jgi:dTDP-4-dehydrorhamnose reductase